MPLPNPDGQTCTLMMGSQAIAYQFTRAARGKPTAIFLPGLFAGAWMWTRAYRHASAHGYGALAINAAFARIPVRCKDPIAQFRRALDGVISEQALERILICGNSLGGLMAIDYAVYGSTPCRTLASGIPGIGKVNLPGLMLQRTPSKAEALTVARAIFYDHSMVTDAMIADALGCFEQRHFADLLRYLLAVRHYRLSDTMERLRAPLTLVWGEQDRITPLPLWEQAFARDIGSGAIALIRIAECGHSPMLERPDEFNLHLERALARL